MALVIDKLTIKRGERTILSDLSLAVAEGEALLLTGPNGSGKTTLLRTIAGLLQPSGGSITLGGAGGDPGTGIGERCHFVGHLNGIKPALSVAENAEFWAAYLGGSRAAATSALVSFRLADLAPIRAAYLSAGQKRRLGLARLLLAPRPVWLLDEPAVSLDAASQALLAEVVNRHVGAGGIVIAATHQPLGFAPARELRLSGSSASDAATASS
jgi:heme exporter protein A